jgi:hypothetical protein
MDMKKQVNMRVFSSFKFDIDINNDELLKTLWKHKNKIK